MISRSGTVHGARRSARRVVTVSISLHTLPISLRIQARQQPSMFWPPISRQSPEAGAPHVGRLPLAGSKWWCGGRHRINQSSVQAKGHETHNSTSNDGAVQVCHHR